jgi:hypothetical protein
MEQQLYRVVRHAVEDAILGVLGTVLLVGIAFGILVAGAQISPSDRPPGPLLSRPPLP